jgi:hypothetical protein
MVLTNDVTSAIEPGPPVCYIVEVGSENVNTFLYFAAPDQVMYFVLP